MPVNINIVAQNLPITHNKTHDQHVPLRTPLMEAEDRVRVNAASNRKHYAIATSGIISCHLLRPTQAAWIPTCFSSTKTLVLVV